LQVFARSRLRRFDAADNFSCFWVCAAVLQGGLNLSLRIFMIAEIGHFALILAFLISLTQVSLPLVGVHRHDIMLMKFGNFASIIQFILISLAFLCLIISFLNSDFSVSIVASHSHSTQPLLYKISATWGNHEGSMLMWVLILALFGASVGLFGDNLPATLRARVLAIQAMIGASFLAFILFTSNPFARLNPAPLDGAELNPLLQDPGLAFHPPILYFGYVGFSMAFSFAVAALLEGRVDAAWARWVRPWVLAAWSALTLGIAAGSFWAYYELGWGGWWFWDPVENASFMPWLLGTALLHSAIVVERRHALLSWTILLSILTFSLSLIGTFLVRSGVISSVHAFAVDPERGVFILAMIAVASGGALTLFALRAPSMRTGATFAPISRETALTANNFLLIIATLIVFIGTFYPLATELLSEDRVSVGPPYYNLTFVPVMSGLFLIMVFGPMLRWKQDALKEALVKLKMPFILSFGVIIMALIFNKGADLLGAIGLGIATWLILGSSWIIVKRVRLGENSAVSFGQRLRLIPRSVWSLAIAHFGIGITVAGIVATSTWQCENILYMQHGSIAKIAGYEIRLSKVENGKEANFQFERGNFDVVQEGRVIKKIISERRFYPVRQSQTTEAGIWTRPIGNLYIAIGAPSADMIGANKGWAVRLYFHPLAAWIWTGAIIMAFGGVVSLTDRRFRLAVPNRNPSAVSTLQAAE
jgi:cytochrome c-type biogenesis protein CcmF